MYNGVQLDVAPTVPDLMDIGLEALMVDTTLMDKNEAYSAVSRVVKARDLALGGQGAVAKKTGVTSGHLFRGVS